MQEYSLNYFGTSSLNSVPRQVRSVRATSGQLGKVEMMLIGTIITFPWELWEDKGVLERWGTGNICPRPYVPTETATMEEEKEAI